jgi:hypothetical protein
MRQRRLPFRPTLEAFEDRLCPSSTVVLPISAFLAQQGHDSVFTPPVPDENAWSNSAFDPGATSSDPTRFLWADYTGQAAQYLLQHGINLHTTVTGFVTETPIGNTGLMEVSLNLEATNALTWVANVAGVGPTSPPDAVDTAPLELGYRPQDLVANPSLKPALSDVNFQLTFQEDVGADLPDIPRLNENFALYAPPGFAFERFDFQSWGTGTLDPATTAGTPGQTAIVSTSQVADLVPNPNVPGAFIANPNLPGAFPDSFWQEPVDLIPVPSASTHVGYLNGTLFVSDTSNANDNVVVTPTTGGGVTVSSNLGSGTFSPISRVFVGLGSGNSNVQIGNLPGVTVNVTTFDGNNQIAVGNSGKLVVHVGEGNNHIQTGNSSPAAQFVCVSGSGNNQITTANTNTAEFLVAGNGNNHLSASGTGDFIEVLGNGNNDVEDTGTNDLVWLGGDGNNTIDNAGMGSLTEILAGNGHNKVRGHLT